MTKEEFRNAYKLLTPENKRKLNIKLMQLLDEERGVEVNTKEYYYFFDCRDSGLSEKYMTAKEVNKLITGEEATMKEADMISIAIYYGASLYRYMFDDEKNPINEVILYDYA
jgi:hypothetical protein